jgi:hypothetical protein
MMDVAELESQLSDADAAVRAWALSELAALLDGGRIERLPESGAVNMHCHTFYSFNAYGHSPSALAWLGKRQGFEAMGIVDFDVLDGVDEFLDACDLLCLRGTAGIETRVYVPEYARRVINSPGEPGVCYHMGIGFASGTVPESAAPILADLRRRASQRNEGIVDRVNGHLSPVAIDYDRDVLPLTPAGNPTERHMVVAYIDAVDRAGMDPVAFWAERLALRRAEVAAAVTDSPRFQNLVRSRLMKRGGVGYIEPEGGMFPRIEDLHALTVACGALPCGAWLDGTTEVENDPESWLSFLVDKGVVAVNIIPDRNWNIPDPMLRERKVRNLHHVVAVAQALDLPLNIGTEMNSFGQKIVDDLNVPELAPVRQAFLDGAHFVYGHTIMQRALGMGYQSDWAQTHLPKRRQRNEFYTRVGYRTAPGKAGLAELGQTIENPGRSFH